MKTVSAEPFRAALFGVVCLVLCASTTTVPSTSMRAIGTSCFFMKYTPFPATRFLQ
jgi:hypothetical protein